MLFLEMIQSSPNRMNATFSTLLFLFISLSSFGQQKIEGTTYLHFSIVHKKDIIDFAVADTNLSIVKPILIFCQGSQPVPLFIRFPKQGIIPIPLSNFDLTKLNQDFHVVVISMPHTPIISDLKHLNQQYNYITDTSYQHSYSEDYLRADYSENYVRRANEVIKFLRKQKWVNSEKIVVAGHSQGARVAVGIAAENKYVSALGLFGYNPFGRIDQSIRQARKDAEKGSISWEKADTLAEQQINFYESFQDDDTVQANPGLISWQSFSKSTLDILTKLKIPVYVAYGSLDTGADFCDYLPLYFIDNNKTNYCVKRYANLEHNFFPIDENGRPDYANGKWNEVIQTFIQWTYN